MSEPDDAPDDAGEVSLDKPTAKPATRAEELEAAAAKLLAEAKSQRAAERAAARKAPPADAPTSRATGWIVATAVTATLLVVALVAGVLWIVHLNNRNDELAAKYQKGRRAAASATAGPTDALRASALSAAKEYAADFASFDYQHLDADFAKVTAHLTPAFANSYQSVAAKLKATVVELKGRSTATVQAAAVQSVSATSAVVLIFVDQSITSAQSSTPRIDRQRMQMSLLRSKGTWLVDKLVLV